MSIRTFIFCDICNPQAIRSIEFRRAPRKSEHTGRRISDGRSWFEGTLQDAIQNDGWELNEQGEHLCSNCKKVKI